MSATSVLFIDDLEKESTERRKCDRDDEEKPDKRISVYTITEEDTLSQKYHHEIDDNERDKSWMFFYPREFAAASMYASFICFLKPKIIPKYGEKYCLEYSDGERSRSENSEKCLLWRNVHPVTVYAAC